MCSLTVECVLSLCSFRRRCAWMDTLELVVPATSCKRNAGDERQLVSSCGVLQLCVDALNPHNNLQSFDNSLSVCVCVCVCVCANLALSLSLCVCVRAYTSIYLSIYLSILLLCASSRPQPTTPTLSHALYVCLVCMPHMPYVYTLYVCLICMPYMYLIFQGLLMVWQIAAADNAHVVLHQMLQVPYMYALYVCLICMPYMCSHVVLHQMLQVHTYKAHIYCLAHIRRTHVLHDAPGAAMGLFRVYNRALLHI